jgi:purine-binding chemotaxis protein CheW
MADFLTDIDKEKSLAQKAEEILARRADSLARESSGEETTDRVALLLFRIGDEWYAVRVSEVREIFQEYRMTTVPCVPEFVIGVVNVRGEILSITDPAKLMRLGFIDLEAEAKPPAIVIISGDVATALICDEIGDIAEVSNDDIEPPVSIIDRAQAEFIAGSVHVGDSMVGLLSTERMLQPVVTSGRN